jgi:hypothetical protein
MVKKQPFNREDVRLHFGLGFGSTFSQKVVFKRLSLYYKSSIPYSPSLKPPVSLNYRV